MILEINIRMQNMFSFISVVIRLEVCHNNFFSHLHYSARKIANLYFVGAYLKLLKLVMSRCLDSMIFLAPLGFMICMRNYCFLSL